MHDSKHCKENFMYTDRGVYTERDQYTEPIHRKRHIKERTRPIKETLGSDFDARQPAMSEKLSVYRKRPIHEKRPIKKKMRPVPETTWCTTIRNVKRTSCIQKERLILKKKPYHEKRPIQEKMRPINETTWCTTIRIVNWTSFIQKERLMHKKKVLSKRPTDYRVAKTHRIPYLYRSFSAKVTYI